MGCSGCDEHDYIDGDDKSKEEKSRGTYEIEKSK